MTETSAAERFGAAAKALFVARGDSLTYEGNVLGQEDLDEIFRPGIILGAWFDLAFSWGTTGLPSLALWDRVPNYPINNPDDLLSIDTDPELLEALPLPQWLLLLDFALDRVRQGQLVPATINLPTPDDIIGPTGRLPAGVIPLDAIREALRIRQEAGRIHLVPGSQPSERM